MILEFAYDSQFDDDIVFRVFHTVKNKILPSESSIRSVEALLMQYPELDRESDLFVDDYFKDCLTEATPEVLIDQKVSELVPITNHFLLIRLEEPRLRFIKHYMGVLANLIRMNISTGGGATCFKKRCECIFRRIVEPRLTEAQERAWLAPFQSDVEETVSAVRHQTPEDEKGIIDNVTQLENKTGFEKFVRRVFDCLKEQIIAAYSEGSLESEKANLRQAIKKLLVKTVRKVSKLKKLADNTPRLIQKTFNNVIADVKRLTGGHKKKKKHRNTNKKVLQPSGSRVLKASETVNEGDFSKSSDSDVDEDDSESSDTEMGNENIKTVYTDSESEKLVDTDTDMAVKNEVQPPLSVKSDSVGAEATVVDDDSNEDSDGESDNTGSGVSPSSLGGSLPPVGSPAKKGPTLQQKINKDLKIMKKKTRSALKKLKKLC